MKSASRLFDPETSLAVEAERADALSTTPGRTVQQRLASLHAPGGLLAAERPASQSVAALARTLATIAWSDMSLAFSLWCHRMVIEYLRTAGPVSAARRWLPKLEGATTFGSTALAAAMAHHVSGAPLPIKAQPHDRGFVLEGRVRWASNLFKDGFVLVTAVERPGQSPLVVALSPERAGLTIDPYPDLLDLQETSSSSLRLTGVSLTEDEIVATDFDRFIRRVRPLFLLAQASFCWGLGARSLAEAAGQVGRGPNEVFTNDLRTLEVERDGLEAAIADGIDVAAVILAGDAGSNEPTSPLSADETRKIVGLRLRAARLADAATRLESKVIGGAGYARASATARRLREAAFLPIQSPTEGQLLWELSRSR